MLNYHLMNVMYNIVYVLIRTLYNSRLLCILYANANGKQ